MSTVSIMEASSRNILGSSCFARDRDGTFFEKILPRPLYGNVFCRKEEEDLSLKNRLSELDKLKHFIWSPAK